MSLLNKNLLWIVIMLGCGNIEAMSRFSRFLPSAQAMSQQILKSQASKAWFKVPVGRFIDTTKNMSTIRETVTQVTRTRNTGRFTMPYKLGIAAAGIATGTGLYVWYQQPNLSEQNIEEYTVNLMWINKHLQENQKFIYPAASVESVHKDLLQHLFKWACVTQDGAIVFWYDSAVTPARAIQNTQILISDYSRKNPTCAAIRLQDVRSLQYVKQHPEVFSDKTPVYFRVDLLKAVASLETVEKQDAPPFVLADLDMDPLTKEQLFDEGTVALLNTHGMVMASISNKYENGFFILNNKNKHLLNAMHEKLVKSNIERATDMVKNPKDDFGNRMRYLPEAVYRSYPAMFAYYDHLQNNSSTESYGYYIPLKPVPLPLAQGNYYADIKYEDIKKD